MMRCMDDHLKLLTIPRGTGVLRGHAHQMWPNMFLRTSVHFAPTMCVDKVRDIDEELNGTKRTGQYVFSRAHFPSYSHRKLPVKNLPAMTIMRIKYTMNFSSPRNPTSCSAVGSSSAGPTSSPLASFSSRSRFLSSHARCSCSCFSLYCL